MTSKLLPPVPNPQGLSSSTFKTPPIDGSLSVAEVFDYNAEHSPEHPLFLYQEPLTNKSTTVTWRSVRRATHRVAQIVKSHQVPAPRVVAILALVDTITYFTLIHGIIRAGYVPFPLSPRNSPAAIAHLLAKTECKHIFLSEDPSMQGLAAGSLKILAGQGDHQVKRIVTPFFDELYESRPKEDSIPIPKTKGVDLAGPGLILHSSGKTLYAIDSGEHSVLRYNLVVTNRKHIVSQTDQDLSQDYR
jgi:acyl-CoA synthetase (AMP-forming)/AMP-acid ligase II